MEMSEPSQKLIQGNQNDEVIENLNATDENAGDKSLSNTEIASQGHLKLLNDLHNACFCGESEKVSRLINSGTEGGVDTKALLCAIGSGCKEVVTLLIREKPSLFFELIDYGTSELVMQVLRDEGRDWWSLLRQTQTDNQDNTPFREMIRKKPVVAETVLDWCIKPTDTAFFEYERVTFNYELVEDFQDAEATPEQEHGYQRKQTFGPKKFARTNHPLAIMVEHGRLNLLSHPLILCLLHQKWLKFGQYVYYLNLFTYCLFLVFLTTFTLIIKNPRSPSCLNTTGENKMDDYCGITIAHQSSIYGCAIVVIIMAIFRLMIEGIQLFKSMKWKYLTDWINYMEAVLYISSILFVWVFHNDCLCAANWQWQLGALAVFLGWINLTVFVSHLPLIGVYVLMFVHIFFTFLKVLTLSVLLIVAFGLAFYIAFTQPEILDSPFSSPARSLLKIMSMTAGDFDYNSIFQLDSTGESDVFEDVPFPPISYVLWVVFIIIMPILFTNMLIGLAVGDIKEVQDEAKLRKLKLQVNLVLISEEILPVKLRFSKRLMKKEVSCGEHEKKHWYEKLQFKLWGGEPYDTREKLEKFTKKHGKEKETNELIQQVKGLKQSIDEIESILEGTSQAEK